MSLTSGAPGRCKPCFAAALVQCAGAVAVGAAVVGDQVAAICRADIKQQSHRLRSLIQMCGWISDMCRRCECFAVETQAGGTDTADVHEMIKRADHVWTKSGLDVCSQPSQWDAGCCEAATATQPSQWDVRCCEAAATATQPSQWDSGCCEAAATATHLQRWSCQWLY
jgi:hypothetical protein